MRAPLPPTRLPVICSPFHEWQDDRQERAAVWVSMCVFNAYVWGERVEGSFLLLYKRRQQLLSVVFSLFLWPAGRGQNIQVRDEPSLQIPNTAMIPCPVCIYIVLLNSTMWKNKSHRESWALEESLLQPSAWRLSGRAATLELQTNNSYLITTVQQHGHIFF